MSKIKKYHSVKLIIGFIFNNETALRKAKSYLKKYFGQIDFESIVLPFIHSDYYDKEFGKNLKRQFISFQKLINAERLADIKIISNKIEEKLAINHRLREMELTPLPRRGDSFLRKQEGGAVFNPRSINIDPGYLDMAKLILATTKDFVHRIYLKKGIFSEVTLFYRDKSFSPWEWSYPDYKTKEYLSIFNQIRTIYAQQTKNLY
ncbi:MAG: DUF4416 family protein [Candidatus Omnitrophota bacterium]